MSWVCKRCNGLLNIRDKHNGLCPRCYIKANPHKDHRYCKYCDRVIDINYDYKEHVRICKNISLR